MADIPIPEDMQQKPKGAPKSGYAAMLPFLHKQGRTVERVLGDGNCLFRSLSLQLDHWQSGPPPGTEKNSDKISTEQFRSIRKTEQHH